MAAMALTDVEAACAICGAQGLPECPHEGQRLQMALDQAQGRWSSMNKIRDWVLNHARNQVIHTFQTLKAQRMETHRQYLLTLPCYSLYQRYHGHPPMDPMQLQTLLAQIAHANAVFKQGIDEDWRRSCMRYPEVLDYYFGLVRVNFPDETDTKMRDPRFGGTEAKARKPKSRRDSVGNIADVERIDRPGRRRSRGKTPPPGGIGGIGGIGGMGNIGGGIGSIGTALWR